MSSSSLFAEWGEAVEVDALTRVRDGTRRLHRQLDRESSLRRLASPDCSLTQYRAALVPLARAYARVDRLLIAGESFRPVGLVPYRARSPLIGPALAALVGRPRPLVPADACRPIDSKAAYLGCRYVIDGAQFGHAVIARALAGSELAGALSTQALSFWQIRFLAPDEWRGLCRRLANMSTRAEAAAVTLSARRIFELFKRCFAQAETEVSN